MWTVLNLQENVKAWEILVYYINMKIEVLSWAKKSFCGKQKKSFMIVYYINSSYEQIDSVM